MTIVSFTGSSDELKPQGRSQVQAVVSGLGGRPTAFFSGVAPGVDIWAAACAIKVFPEAKHVVYVPCIDGDDATPLPHDEHGVERLLATANKHRADLVVRNSLAYTADVSKGYMRRNDLLAQNCTHLVAFPKTAREQQRSGTWATIRRAQALGRPVLLCPLGAKVGDWQRL